jgi:hypothetical protein
MASLFMSNLGLHVLGPYGAVYNLAICATPSVLSASYLHSTFLSTGRKHERQRHL